MNVALPILNNRLAPCFEAAREFLLVKIENSRQVSARTITCSGREGFHRIRLLRIHEIDALICNGIKEFYLDLLLSIDIKVYPTSGGSIESVLDRFLAGELECKKRDQSLTPGLSTIELDEMITWARSYFEKSGFRVYDGPGQDSFLIDLIAEMNCPRCGREIRIAICCGAHTYSTEQEIQEFNYCSKATFNSRIFIYPENVEISARCREFGIELISPFCEGDHPKGKCEIPILTLPVEGHPDLRPEKAGE